MLEITSGGSITEGGADALVVPANGGGVIGAAADWLAEAVPWLGGHLEDLEFEGKTGKVFSFPGGDAVPYGRVVVVGVGDDPDPEALRQAAGAAARATSKSVSVATTLHDVAVERAEECVTLGFSLGNYSFDRHKSDPKSPKVESLTLIGGNGEGLASGEAVARGVTLARDLVNEPAMGKSPEAFAALASDVAEEVGLRIRIYDEGEIESEGLGGLRGVSLGAANPPRLVELWHEPAEATGFLAVVGKGIIFDSGGLSLKPAASMETMKTDMSGAAATLGAMRAIAELGLGVKVVGFMPLTENMPGGAAIRPGDVLKARNGKTIEVMNTDAEGRLVLADGLSLAAELEPDLIVDLATLTGACHIALGDKIAGLFGTDDAVEFVREAAGAVGERVWPLPLPADYRKLIDSDIADMKNTGPRYGGAIHAASLLKEFVGDLPWAHLDIAGPARAAETENYVLKGGTGMGVRTVVGVAERLGAGSGPGIGTGD